MISKKTKYESASQAATKDLGEYVDQVAEALGHPGAFVTDDSFVGDMLEMGGIDHRMKRRGGPWVYVPGDPEIAKRNAETLRLASEALKVPVEPGDRLIVVARRLRNLARA
jgi:hypothetical protein